MRYNLNDITLYYPTEGEKAKEFACRQNVVSDLYVHYLDGYKPPKTSRISVMLGDEDAVGQLSRSILRVSARFERDLYWRLSDNDKNRMILDTIHRIALLCAEQFGWDVSIFENARQRVLDCNFIYAIEGERKLSRDRKHKASIHITKDLKSALISARFYDNSNHFIRSVQLLESWQSDWFYSGLTKNQKWFNAVEFGICTTREEIIIKASLETGKSEVIINPREKTREELEGYLRMVTWTEIETPEDLVKWVNR